MLGLAEAPALRLGIDEKPSRGSLNRRENHCIDVNVRCLDDVDLAGIAIAPFDGRGDWQGARAALGDL